MHSSVCFHGLLDLRLGTRKEIYTHGNPRGQHPQKSRLDFQSQIGTEGSSDWCVEGDYTDVEPLVIKFSREYTHVSMPQVLNILIKILPVGTKIWGNLLRKFMGVWAVISSLIYPSVLGYKEKGAINVLGRRWCGHQSRKRHRGWGHSTSHDFW